MYFLGSWNGWTVAVIDNRVWLVNPRNGHRVRFSEVPRPTTLAPDPEPGAVLATDADGR